MTETRVDELLDEHVPAIEPCSDGWDDVLARAHTTRGARRHYDENLAMREVQRIDMATHDFLSLYMRSTAL